MDCHEKFVDAALSEADKRKGELMLEQQSMRSGSRVSFTSSAEIRAQAHVEAIAAVKKAEMQKKNAQLSLHSLQS